MTTSNAGNLNISQPPSITEITPLCIYSEHFFPPSQTDMTGHHFTHPFL